MLTQNGIRPNRTIVALLCDLCLVRRAVGTQLPVLRAGDNSTATVDSSDIVARSDKLLLWQFPRWVGLELGPY